MNKPTKRKRCQMVFSSILCLVLLIGLIGFGDIRTAKAEGSLLITPYKPQVQNVDVDVSYTDSSGNTISGTIHHPGIALRQADLDNMRDHVRAGNEPWNTAFEAFASDRRSSKTPRIHYDENNDLFVNIRGPWAYTDENGNHWPNPSGLVGDRANWDSETAFHQAIMWYITGDETYRSNAMYIIRAYSSIQSVVPHTNFRFATATYLLGAAAEILRYSETPTDSLNWTEADTQNLSNMMDLLRNAYEGRHPNFFMNQHQFAVMGIMARAIFTNDLELYAEAVEATTVNAAGEDGGRNGSIKHQMRMMTHNEMTGEPLDPSDVHVQFMEMGRDAGHTYANIAGLSTLVQTIYAQGTKVDPIDGTMSTAANAVNPFNFLDDRLLEGVTYALKYHLGYDVPWTPAVANQHYAGQIFHHIDPFQRGRIDGYNSVLYNYYKYIEGQDMTEEKYKYLAYAYKTRMPEIAGKDYPLHTLLYTPDAAKADGLSNRIILGNITGLTATMAGSDAIDLSWTAVPDALGYNIYRSTEENGTYTQINSAPITTTSYSDTSLTPNTIYYYKVHVSGGSTSGVVSATTGGDGIPALDVSSDKIPVNHTHQSVLRVIHPDRSIEDLTSQASFTSSDPTVATVDSAGLVTGISAGTATITATYNGQPYQATVNVVVDSNLTTWYHFDETSGTKAADSSGHGHNGTLHEGAAWTEEGKTEGAIDLAGSGYVRLPDSSITSDELTVATWVNWRGGNAWQRLFDFGNNTSQYVFLTPRSGANTMRFAIRNGDSEQMIETLQLPANEWVHVAVTLGNGTATLYVDGKVAASADDVTVKPSDFNPVNNYIGKSQWPDPYLDGRVDDFRVYNRAISASEVASVMNGQTLESVPTAPTGVTASAADQSSINLSWSAVPRATGYHVYVADSLAENAIYTKVNHDVITETSFASQGLKENTTYYYKVTAVNEIGESSTSAIASATTGSMPNASLISWYKFDETSGTVAADSSGHGHNGTLHEDAAWTEEGKTEGAIDLAGSGYVTLPDSSITSDELTVATWVNWRGGNAWQRLFDFGNNTSQYVFLTPRSGANTMRFAIRNGDSEQMIETLQLPANEWVHVAVTLGNGTATLYVDGEVAASADDITVKPSDFNPVNNYIGKSQWPDPLFNGMIDEFYVFSKALSTEEINALANREAVWVEHTSLNLLLEEAEAIDADLYTDESVVILEATVAEARQIAANANASQEEIEAVCVKLLEALKALEVKIPELTAEVQPSKPNGKNGWYTEPVAVDLNPFEQVEYSLNEGRSWVLYEGPVTLREEGIHELLYRYINAEEDVKSLEVKIDLTSPQVDIVGEASYTIDDEIIISCIATDVISSVNGTPCDEPLLQIMAYELEPGEHTGTVEAEDMAGHRQTAQWTFDVEATYDSLAVLSERFVTETGTKGKGANGIINALKKKLANAEQASERGDYEAAQDLLQSYIDQVKDLEGKKLSEAQADVLVRWGEWLRDTMPLN
ncbi:LamG-like jellyroll fold domain-containing protein [Halalkalibacterium halodurans]|uniref:LamG-like jellyroll fold domain-containing protein n=1 Tax=Halalkalibacterium halodurans TaxID=86665 RepID=UPI002AA9D7B3|nr:LamG-like jellyroll fold domain-containing protein [Halalkalibacterium halodurans]MDY7223283.1 LamG-like jellyroll fold domain-containing protein [Halalkalibacterium halodurans]MDY7242504.1 LamG-like jellyroll fold domain-containing protein [Halalkalibacterium halodurans]